MDFLIGHIQSIYRYPVKSMAGELLERTLLGWHGIEGDRRFAFRRVSERGGFPWLTAGKLPDLILYRPVREGVSQDSDLPTHIVTPEGNVLGIGSDALREAISNRFGSAVEMMQLKQGIFDDAVISLISVATNQKISDESGIVPDIRRFRPNIVIDTHQCEPFTEDQLVGKRVIFGDAKDSVAIQVTQRDLRCAMVNLDPDSAQSSPAVMKTIVQLNQNYAGVYGTVIQVGELSVGQPVYLKERPSIAVPTENVIQV